MRRLLGSRFWRGAAALALLSCVACRRGDAQQRLQITIKQPTYQLAVGDTVRVLPVVIVSTQEAPVTVAWSSDNDAVARVDRSGLVTARAPGVTGITARVGTAFASTRMIVSNAGPPRETAATGTSARSVAAAPAPVTSTPAPKTAPPAAPARATPAPRASTPPARASATTAAPARSAPEFGTRKSRSPHFSHISLFYTDFYSRWASPADQRATISFLSGRLDGVMSGPRDLWKAGNPTISHFAYALQPTVPIPGQKSAGDNIATAYFADMERWYQRHKEYDFENAFLHRGGHDSAHRVKLKIWDSMRNVVNPGDAGQRAYQVDRIKRIARNEEGVFLDEFGGSLSGAGKPSDEYKTQAEYLAAETVLIAQMHEAIKPGFLLINIAEYWSPTDSAIAVAGGGAHLERTDFPFNDHMTSRWVEIDHLLAMNVYTEFVTLWAHSDWKKSKTFPSFTGGMYSSRMERGQILQLASYYMVVPENPQRLSLDQQNMWDVRPDTAWIPAVEVDVGHPREARHLIASGVDAAAQKYRIYARDFDHAYVVIRPQISWHEQTYADSTGIAVPLPAPMRPLHRDGSLGPAVRSVTLRNVEAAILFK